MARTKKNVNEGNEGDIVNELPSAETIKSEITALQKQLKEAEKKLKQKKADLVKREAIDVKEFNAKTGEAINVAFPNLTQEQIVELINVGLKAKKTANIEDEKE